MRSSEKVTRMSIHSPVVYVSDPSCRLLTKVTERTTGGALNPPSTFWFESSTTAWLPSPKAASVPAGESPSFRPRLRIVPPFRINAPLSMLTPSMSRSPGCTWYVKMMLYQPRNP